MTNDRFTRWRQPPGVGIVVLALCCLTASISRPAERAMQPTSKMSPRDALEAHLRRQTEPYRNAARLKFGVIADTHIDGAEEIGNGTAEQIFGWYLEVGYHFMPDTWKHGKLAKSDAVVFVRYDDYDTQYDMPSGVAADPAGSRTEWTTGLNFYLISQVVLKADYQIRDDDSDEDLGDRINLGLGWVF